MSVVEPTPNAMSVEGQPEQTLASQEQQKEVMRLRGGGNTFIDCLA